MRRFWGWVWVCLALSLVTRAAWAKEEEGYLPVHVCVRPPYLRMEVIVWTYYASTTDFIYVLSADYATKRYKYPTYLYDPEAPPENTQQLPREEDRKRPCDPKPPPPAPPPKEPPPKEEAPKPGGSGASGSSGHGGDDKKGEPKERAQSSPKAPPEAQARASEEEAARHPRLPAHGVTTDWPNAVLPKHQGVLRTRREGEVCSMVLPTRATPRSPIARACGNGEGDGDGKGVKKTWVDKFAENLAYTAGGINLQFDEDLKRADGKQYGVMGGRNPDGPNNPVAQAVASGVMIAAAVLSPKAEKFFKRLRSAKKAAPLLMKEMEKVGLGVADELATKLGPQHGGEIAVRRYLADGLQQKGAIGPYEVMKQFTEQLEGEWQAHHILESAQARSILKLRNTDKLPSVILTKAEHKEFTAKLAAEVRGIKNLNPMKLWKVYQDVYEHHPTWLEAIKSYFLKSK